MGRLCTAEMLSRQLPSHARARRDDAGGAYGSSVAAPRLIAAAHGTKSAAGLATLAELSDRIRRARPAVEVELCYLDVLEPSLRSRLDRRSGPSVVVPMLLSTGYHVVHDIPSVTADRPAVRVADRLGPDPLLSAALVDRLAEVAGMEADCIALVGSGSSHPAAAVDLAHAADDLADRLRGPVVPITLDAESRRRIAELTQRGSVAIATYLLAEGFFASQVRAAAAGRPVSAPIGAHPAVVELVWRRYDEAVGAWPSGMLPESDDAAR
jgi:sirohydrochlorin ferrochelatase